MSTLGSKGAQIELQPNGLPQAWASRTRPGQNPICRLAEDCQDKISASQSKSVPGTFATPPWYGPTTCMKRIMPFSHSRNIPPTPEQIHNFYFGGGGCSSERYCKFETAGEGKRNSTCSQIECFGTWNVMCASGSRTSFVECLPDGTQEPWRCCSRAAEC